MPLWLDGSQEKKYFRTLEDIAHILVNDAVTIHLIDWIPGPAQETPKGNRNPGPLTDFVVLISPEDPKDNHCRIRLQTSDRG